MTIHLRITRPGSVLSVLADRDIPEPVAEQIVALLQGEVYGDTPPTELLIPARTLSNAETADIAVTAAEGGVNYWASAPTGYDFRRWTTEQSDFSDNRIDLPDDFVFYRLRYENPNDEGYLETDVTPELIRRGIQLVVSPPHTIRKDLEQQVLDAVRGTPDDVDIDADAADCIVQLGIFGEVVFG
jgi:hypothetical protein